MSLRYAAGAATQAIEQAMLVMDRKPQSFTILFRKVRQQMAYQCLMILEPFEIGLGSLIQQPKRGNSIQQIVILIRSAPQVLDPEREP